MGIEEAPLDVGPWAGAVRTPLEVAEGAVLMRSLTSSKENVGVPTSLG